MAIRTITESDISGKPDAATVSFAIGDTWYEIDLTSEEQADLEQALATYVAKGRKAQRVAAQPKHEWPETTPDERNKVREWAQANGYEVSEFGRIPKRVTAAYHEAHTGK